MTDPEPVPETTPVRDWRRGPLRTGARAPSVAVPDLPQEPVYVQGVYQATPGSSAELFAARYSRAGSSPLPYLVLALGAMAGAAWTLDWAKLAPGAEHPVRSSAWWTNTTAVLLPGEPLRIGAFSEFRMWVALGVLVAAALLLVLWIGRLGTNLHAGQEPFGSFLPIITFPAWWILPITVGTVGAGPRTNADTLIRYLVAFGILVAQFLLLRWPLLNRIWRSGRVPYDMASILLWLPNFIAWAVLFLSTSYTYLVIGKDGVPADSGWQPTANMLDWARWSSRISGIALVALLIVVSVVQQVCMSQDRAADDARRLK